MAAYRTTIRNTSDTTSYRLPSMAGVAKGRGRLPEEFGAFHIDLMFVGGDEFCAILPATNLYGAKKMAERLDSWLASRELSFARCFT